VRHAVILSSLVAIHGCSSSRTGDTGTCPPFGDYEDVPVAASPPLPDDACDDPPSATSAAIEASLQASQEAADAAVEALLGADVITVVACGTGSPIPSDRAQSCTAVFAGGQFLLFDAGDGAQSSMEDLGLPIADLDAVFLTHYHSDHIADLGEVISRSWIVGRTHTLPVYGGPAIERVVDGFNLVYTPDETYRRAHHGEAIFPPGTLPAQAHRIEGAGTGGTTVYSQGGVVVKAYDVDHAPVSPAIGYRVEYGGRAVGISGDTVDVAGLRALADGADVLVSDVMDKGFVLDVACAFERLEDERNASLFRDIRTYHVGVDELAEVSAGAGVGTLVLTHQVPSLSETQAQLLFGTTIGSVFDGEVVVAVDGTSVTVTVE
jgi:ribonuclease Z